jgi:hypothetical protein
MLVIVHHSKVSCLEQVGHQFVKTFVAYLFLVTHSSKCNLLGCEVTNTIMVHHGLDKVPILIEVSQN